MDDFREVKNLVINWFCDADGRRVVLPPRCHFAVGEQEGPSCWWVQHEGLQGKGLRSALSSDERGGASWEKKQKRAYVTQTALALYMQTWNRFQIADFYLPSLIPFHISHASFSAAYLVKPGSIQFRTKKLSLTICVMLQLHFKICNMQIPYQ